MDSFLAQNLFALMPVFPLVGWLVLIVFGKRMREPIPGVIASGLVLASFAVAVAAFFQVRGLEEPILDTVRWDFLPGVGPEGENLRFGFALDPLSSLMSLIITGVGFLIHVYSIGYMHKDLGFSRFFAYLNFFVALMLILVLADSIPVAFIGWEGVGVASYLLIGFHYQEAANGDAARKAFIVNRVGDLFFMLGMFLVYKTFGTLNFRELDEAARAFAYNAPALNLIGLFFLMGAAGKSAQLPLSTWLPDAMAGPTPVSALIHAATMVTAGVYLVARMSGLFSGAPDASAAVAWIGGLTALFGALAAVAQTDIKRILAYSTISQLGYMFMGVGAGAYWAGLFHVTTHAFFKALLFLAAGSVIHALAGEQDVRRMGGLRRALPTTHIVSLIGVLAIAGIPILSGFFSKDAILASVYASPLLGDFGPALYGLGLLVAVLTAAYMWRWYLLVFSGSYRGKAHPHESPPVMTLPLWVLAGLSAVGGFIGLPHLLGENVNLIEEFVDRAAPHAEGLAEPEGLVGILLILAAVVAAVGGILLAQAWYRRAGPLEVGTVPGKAGEALRRALYYNDGASLIGTGSAYAAEGLSVADNVGVDGAARGTAVALGEAGSALRDWESGFVRAYAVALLLGTAALVVFLTLSARGLV